MGIVAWEMEHGARSMKDSRVALAVEDWENEIPRIDLGRRSRRGDGDIVPG